MDRKSLLTRGHNTNDCCEAAMKIIKEILSKRFVNFLFCHIFSIIVSHFMLVIRPCQSLVNNFVDFCRKA